MASSYRAQLPGTSSPSSSSSYEPRTPSSSHHPRTPTRKHGQRSFTTRHNSRTHHLLIALTFLAGFALTTAASADIYISEQLIETPPPPPAVEENPNKISETFESTLARLARSGTILVDQSPPPKPAGDEWTLASLAEDLRRRQKDDPLGNNNDDDATSASTSATRTSISTSTTTGKEASATVASTRTSGGVVAAETTAAGPLPTPFDNGFSGNVTASCAGFMKSMLQNSTFKACLPFSLLLQNSASFFEVSKSITRITQTLDATCSANSTLCTPLMLSFASDITSSSACAADLATSNPSITQAHLGLLAYEPLYTASCLRNPTTQSYCYADAVTNTTSRTNPYVYFLPLNVSLPAGAQPTCNRCLRDTMAIYGAATADRKNVLAGNYVEAAGQINVMCGPGFANQSLAAPVTSSSTPTIIPTWNMGVLALALLVGSWLL